MDSLEDYLTRAAANIGGRLYATPTGGYRVAGIRPELEARDGAELAARIIRHPATKTYLEADQADYGDR